MRRAMLLLSFSNEVDLLGAIERAMARFSSDSWGVAASMKERMPDPRAQQIANSYLGEETEP